MEGLPKEVQEGIEAFKDKNGYAPQVKEITVKGKTIYVREPSISEYDRALAQLDRKRKPLEFGKFLAELCWLSGDKSVLENIRVLNAIMPVINEFVEAVDVDVKNV